MRDLLEHTGGIQLHQDFILRLKQTQGLRQFIAKSMLFK